MEHIGEPNEQQLTCPYCGETISMVIDILEGHQQYIEDCEVCCNPIQVNCTVTASEVVEFRAESIEQ